ncbi:formimidoylglutamate deiminase [Marinomonas mediterranea]|uniref:formimidoylglutamate deiminase n=1 Tax=Marinomonas mediterranea TaxID=119864 RepID=UPI00234BE6BB|nr:formimidoylglutamate deiminase [Marinomonas mediterranea]WCN10727.1 formimidoylglutamate deiminase [Marinomonas mediterranea]
MTQFFAKRAYVSLSNTNDVYQWKNDVAFTVEQGKITAIEVDVEKNDSMKVLEGPVLPTASNLHSHAFQRLMAGMAEVALNPEDSFWSWRDVMYKTVSTLLPEEMEVIASKLYIELLKGGFTQVGEFHYVHNVPEGGAYPESTCLGEAILRAGDRTKMGVTLLPALYQYAGFGELPPNDGQVRFVQSTDAYIDQYRAYQHLIKDSDRHRLGICFHSLRATNFNAMKQVLGTLDGGQPIHIHIAEQTKEVEDCLDYSGRRPVEWLLSEFDVNAQWCLIHATHLNETEVEGIANSGASVGICTTTEANLGDGFFPATEYEAAGGVWGVGSDSHVSTSLQEELRWLEYGQRLQHQKRNRLYGESQPYIGDHLFAMSKRGGDQACGVQTGLSIGARADFMVWSTAEPFVSASQSKDLLNRWLFGLSSNVIKDVYVAGECVIDNYQHELDGRINDAFNEIVARRFR